MNTKSIRSTMESYSDCLIYIHKLSKSDGSMLKLPPGIKRMSKLPSVLDIIFSLVKQKEEK